MMKKFALHLSIMACAATLVACASTYAEEPAAKAAAPAVTAEPIAVSSDAAAPTLSQVETYKRDLQLIEDYLNSITTFVSTFSQVDSEGARADGTFYLWRPGMLRWEYFPPTPILIIAKGSMLTYYDKELDQVSHVGLDDSLSGFLTRKVIRFVDPDIQIVSFSKGNNRISITIAMKDKEEEGELTLNFSDNEKIDLLGMSVMDAIGKKTEVSFNAIVYDKPLDKNLFILPKIRKSRR